MAVAHFTGQPPHRIRNEWAWHDVEDFLTCLPAIRQLWFHGVSGRE